jgi:hypothetical protein
MATGAATEGSGRWWDPRVFWWWVGANGAAFLIIVFGGTLLLGLTSDESPRGVSTHLRLTVIAVALAASAIYGLVLGRLQWQVLRQQLPTLPIRTWIVATSVPAFIAFALVIGPDALDDVTAGSNPFSVFKEALVQVIVLGPLIGVAQATALQGLTTRWKWWFVGNITSWLFGALTTEAAEWLLGRVATYPGDSTSVSVSPAFPLVAIAFHGLWMLWVTAPEATRDRPSEPHEPGDLRPPVPRISHDENDSARGD